MILMATCSSEQDISNEYVLQINNVGLRKGVFERRFKLTQNYGSHQEFTPEILKTYIQDVLEPDYLFIRDAYAKKIDQEADIQKQIMDSRISLLADNHPILFKKLMISKDELKDFYGKKAIAYDLEIVQTQTYSDADSIYKALLKGHKLEVDKKSENSELVFPRVINIPDVTYGEQLHPEVFPELIKMDEGEISRPIYTSPIWTIVKLNKKRSHKMPKFEDIEKQMVMKSQTLFKYEEQKKLIDSLRTKYSVSVNGELFKMLIAAYHKKNVYGWLDEHKLGNTNLNATIVQIGEHEISVKYFIHVFNQANRYVQFSNLMVEDLNHFINGYIDYYLLYLDADEKGVDQDKFVKDKLENKIHRILLTKYLKEEIAGKITFTEEDVLQHYNNNPQKWNGPFKSVESSVKNDLRMQRMLVFKDKVLEELRNKYHNIQYNETLLAEIAGELTLEKNAANVIGQQ